MNKIYSNARKKFCAGGLTVVVTSIMAVLCTNSANAQLPVITAVTPLNADPGTSINITGSNFNTTAANNTVYFGATKATVTAAAAGSLTVTVPLGATYKTVSVNNTASHLTGFSQKAFLPTFNNSSYAPGVINFDTSVNLFSDDYPYDLAIADVDGDGKPDLVTVDMLNALSVCHNISATGTISAGSFAPKVDLSAGGALDLAVDDLDGDGKPDIAVANFGGATVSLYHNSSVPGTITTSSFATSIDFATGTYPVDVAIADLDGDGKPEVAVVNQYDNTISVFHNTGTSGSITSSSFASKVDFATGALPQELAINDVDGDSKPDIVVTNRDDHTVSVLRNTSVSGSITAASFAAKQDFYAGYVPTGIAIGDLDADGKPELVVSSFDSVNVFRNTATAGSITSGSFAAAIGISTGTLPTHAALGDLDGDGKPDIATANPYSHSISILRNTTTSGSISATSFSSIVNIPAGSYPLVVAIGDLDGDAKPDLAVVQDTGVLIFRNDPLSLITGTTVLCIGSSVTFNNATAGGTWTSSDITIATVDSATGIVAGVVAGTATISYTIASGSATTVVTVEAMPIAGSVIGSSHVCIGDTIMFSNPVSGGTWSSSASNATITAGGIVTGVSAGTVTISYSISNTCGTTAATSNISVEGCPNGISSLTPEPVKIYPNPSRGLLSVDLACPVAFIEINDIAGRLITNLEVRNNSIIDLRDQPAGIYTVRITAGGFSQTSKIRLQK